MKRTTSILFLLVFLFQVIGYYGVYLVVQHHLSAEFSRKVNADEYSGSDAQILKIPMKLPYQPNFDGYQRAQGTFESNGEFYRIAKYTLVQDTLLVVLVKDTKEGDLFHSVNEFAQANSNEAPSSKSPLKMFKNALTEFLLTRSRMQSDTPGWCIEAQYTISITARVEDLPLPQLSPPPEA
jgi:hypothetical protein